MAPSNISTTNDYKMAFLRAELRDKIMYCTQVSGFSSRPGSSKASNPEQFQISQSVVLDQLR